MSKRRPVTIIDVAREAGVSPQTVSRVINDKTDVAAATRQRIQGLIETMGYRPNRNARGLVSSRTWVIGLLITDITNPFFPEVVRGIETVALGHGYNVMLFNSDNERKLEVRALDLMEETRADGVILHGPHIPDEVLVPLLRHQRAAVVIGRTVSPDIAGNVTIDLAHGADQATDHLLKTGRRRLAYLGYQNGLPLQLERGEGIVRAMQRHGLNGDDLLCVAAPNDPSGAYEAGRLFIRDHPEIDGVFCFNDQVALGLLKACREAGVRVPDDMAVIGVDDLFYSQFTAPTLTSVCLPKTEMGEAAVRVLLAMIDGTYDGKPVILRPQLMIRESAP